MKKLSSWKPNTLSFEGRMTLCKSILSSMPNYFMQTAHIPKWLHKDIDKICRGFLWGKSEGRRKKHLCNWDRVCTPKLANGSGLCQSQHMNAAFLSKMGWGLIQNRDDLWAKVLRNKYKYGNHTIPLMHPSINISNLWQGICKTWNSVATNLIWRIGDGETIRFWVDNWVPTCGPLMNYTTQSLPENMMHRKVSSYVNQDGDWHWEEVRNLCPFSH